MKVVSLSSCRNEAEWSHYEDELSVFLDQRSTASSKTSHFPAVCVMLIKTHADLENAISIDTWQPWNALVSRMSVLAPLAKAECSVLHTVARLSRTCEVNTELCAVGQIRSPQAIIEGWAVQQRVLLNGRRQIMRFLLPGDMIGSLTRPKMRALNAVYALTPLVVGDTRPLLRALEDGGAMTGLNTAAGEMDQAADAGMCNQVVRLGCCSSYQRVVHLMLELHSRLAAVGLVEDDSFLLPLSQEMLAQALGMSVVHINRILQKLRSDKLFKLQRGRLHILAMDQMLLCVEYRPEVGQVLPHGEPLSQSRHDDGG